MIYVDKDCAKQLLHSPWAFGQKVTLTKMKNVDNGNSMVTYSTNIRDEMTTILYITMKSAI